MFWPAAAVCKPEVRESVSRILVSTSYADRSAPRRRNDAPVTTPPPTCPPLADHGETSGRSHVFGLTNTRIQGRPPRWQWAGPRPGRPCRSPRSTPRSHPPPRKTTAPPDAAVLRSRRSTVDHTASRSGDFRATPTASTRRSTVTLRRPPQEVDQSHQLPTEPAGSASCRWAVLSCQLLRVGVNRPASLEGVASRSPRRSIRDPPPPHGPYQEWPWWVGRLGVPSGSMPWGHSRTQSGSRR